LTAQPVPSTCARQLPVVRPSFAQICYGACKTRQSLMIKAFQQTVQKGLASQLAARVLSIHQQGSSKMKEWSETTIPGLECRSAPAMTSSPEAATGLQSTIDYARNAFNAAFKKAWAGLMKDADGHTTMAQHHQWAQDAKQLVDDRVAGLQWQDDAYSDDPVRMDNLYSQYHLFELNATLRKAHQDRSAAEPR
jgi:hypothetical protein